MTPHICAPTDLVPNKCLKKTTCFFEELVRYFLCVGEDFRLLSGWFLVVLSTPMALSLSFNFADHRHPVWH